jgi:U3 small nucleolar RNA-associated protein 20
LAQAALKLITAILRERRTIEIKERDLTYLIRRLIPDLEEPDRQGGFFNFIKAVLARKIIVTEVYELLDTIAAIMVTNQNRGARDMARGVYFQFIMEYPQGKDRFSKQLSFLARNLQYKHQEGRQSVMELIHLLFLKIGDSLIQDVIDAFMVPLVMVMVNDESPTCREMAGQLLKTSIERADPKKRQSFLTLLRTWLDQWENPLLPRVALQLYLIYLDIHAASVEGDLPLLLAHIAQILKRSLADKSSADWEMLYFGLQTFAKTSQLYPQQTFAPSAGPIWASVCESLWYPHAWVKLSASKLLETYFSDYARTNASSEVLELPLRGSGGMLLESDQIVAITRASLAMLELSSINEDLASQSARNLVFLGRIMNSTTMLWQLPTQHQETRNDGSDVDDERDETLLPPGRKTALHFVFERVSAIVRRGPSTTQTQSLISLTASLQVIGALSTHLPLSALTPCLPTILLPLHNLTDTAIPAPYSPEEAFTTGYKTLVSNAGEIMSILQKKLGTTEFIAQLSRVREWVKERREGRKMKRRIETVTEPEKAGKAKVRKGEKRKEKRKMRGREQAGMRRGW